MKPVFLIIFCALLPACLPAQGRLAVSPDGHYLEYADGSPFFWLGDTGWDLLRQLKPREMEQYFANRKHKGFTVIQAAVLPRGPGFAANVWGEPPFLQGDPARPNEKYFRLLDTALRLAAEKGLFLALVPAWGDKVVPDSGSGPALLDGLKAYRYGRWLGGRYAAANNIIWVLGGSRPAASDTSDSRPVWRQMAEGIRNGGGGKALLTYFPPAGHSSSEWLHAEPWLSLNLVHSGSTGGHDAPVWHQVTRDYHRSPPKPTLDAGINFEDHVLPAWPKWDTARAAFREGDVRRQAYRSVFAGAAGAGYGHGAVASFHRKEATGSSGLSWTEALDRPGAGQMGYLRALIASRPGVRVPDSTLIVAGQGDGFDYVTAFRDEKNTYCMVYLPRGKNIPVHTSFLKSDSLVVWWFNPRTGDVKRIGPKQRSYMMSFTPPTLGSKNDWVLVLDYPGAGYGPPGGKQ